jgi:hypothetical protein
MIVGQEFQFARNLEVDRGIEWVDLGGVNGFGLSLLEAETF